MEKEFWKRNFAYGQVDQIEMDLLKFLNNEAILKVHWCKTKICFLPVKRTKFF